jgi:hypothetical protein
MYTSSENEKAAMTQMQEPLNSTGALILKFHACWIEIEKYIQKHTV